MEITKHSRTSVGFEGVRRCDVETSIDEDSQGAHSSEDNEDPEEHAVHHHGHVLPVLFQLSTREESTKWRRI